MFGCLITFQRVTAYMLRLSDITIPTSTTKIRMEEITHMTASKTSFKEVFGGQMVA